MCECVCVCLLLHYNTHNTQQHATRTTYYRDGIVSSLLSSLTLSNSRLKILPFLNLSISQSLTRFGCFFSSSESINPDTVRNPMPLRRSLMLWR